MPKINFETGQIERTFTETVKFRVIQFKDWACEKVKNTAEYVKENPQNAATILGLGATAVGGATKFVRAVNRHRAIRQEKWHREREVYDPSLKIYLTTTRKLRQEDTDRINRLRREKGLKVSEAMSKLGLLKK